MIVNTGAAQREATRRDVYNGHVVVEADGTRKVKLITDNNPVAIELDAAEADSLAQALKAEPGSRVLLEVRAPFIPSSPTPAGKGAVGDGSVGDGTAGDPGAGDEEAAEYDLGDGL